MKLGKSTGFELITKLNVMHNSLCVEIFSKVGTEIRLILVENVLNDNIDIAINEIR